MTALPSEPVRRPCHAKLNPGDYRRVPKPVTRAPVGYFFGCLKCGFTIVVRTRFIDRDNGLAVTECAGVLTALAAVTCEKCSNRFVIKDGRYVDA